MKIDVIDNLQRQAEPLTDTEAERVATLIRQNTQDVNEGEYTPAEMEKLNAFAIPKKIQEEMRRGYLVTLSNDEGDLVGCALVVRKGMSFVIKTIQVRTEYCRKGYGSLLYKQCEKRLKQIGMNQIEVEVPKFQRTEIFYKKHGFVKTGNPTQRDLYFAMFKYL